MLNAAHLLQQRVVGHPLVFSLVMLLMGQLGCEVRGAYYTVAPLATAGTGGRLHAARGFRQNLQPAWGACARGLPNSGAYSSWTVG